MTSVCSSQRGYTMVELIMAMAVFSIILVISSGAFVNISNSTNKASAQRRVQQDVRFNLEEISRQTRAAAIDYDFYKANANTTCRVSDRRVLAMIHTEANATGQPQNKRVIYYFDSSATNPGIYRFENEALASPPACADLINTNQAEGITNVRATADNLKVVSSMFQVLPTENPFDSTSSLPARYLHPSVMIAIKVETISPDGGPIATSRQSSAAVHTTVSTRGYISPNK